MQKYNSSWGEEALGQCRAPAIQMEYRMETVVKVVLLVQEKATEAQAQMVGLK